MKSNISDKSVLMKLQHVCPLPSVTYQGRAYYNDNQPTNVMYVCTVLLHAFLIK